MDVQFQEVGDDLIEAALEQYRPQLEKAIVKSNSETCFDWVRAQCLLGQMKFYLCTANGEMAGFIMTELSPGRNGSWSGIPFGWGEPKFFGNGTDLFGEAMGLLKETAEKLGCRGVRLISSRKGMYRRATGLGMKPRFIEYVWERNGAGSD